MAGLGALTIERAVATSFFDPGSGKGQGAGLVGSEGASPSFQEWSAGESRSFHQVGFASRSAPPAVWCDGNRVRWEPEAQIGGGAASDEVLRQMERRRCC